MQVLLPFLLTILSVMPRISLAANFHLAPTMAGEPRRAQNPVAVVVAATQVLLETFFVLSLFRQPLTQPISPFGDSIVGVLEYAATAQTGNDVPGLSQTLPLPFRQLRLV